MQQTERLSDDKEKPTLAFGIPRPSFSSLEITVDVMISVSHTQVKLRIKPLPFDELRKYKIHLTFLNCPPVTFQNLRDDHNSWNGWDSIQEKVRKTKK